MEYLQRTECANTPNDAGDVTARGGLRGRRYRKEDPDTRMETLLAVFEQLMATVEGSFGDREAAALQLGNELVRRLVCGRAACRRERVSPSRGAIPWGHLGYLDRHRKYLRYASCRKRGLAIGSGVTEGACKSVITMRFKRSGQRWFEEGLSPCLQLRALHLNERLRPCFDLLVAARTATLAAA